MVPASGKGGVYARSAFRPRERDAKLVLKILPDRLPLHGFSARHSGGTPGRPAGVEERMSALSFVDALLETGRVRVPASRASPADLDAAVVELDRAVRPELA